MIKKDANQHEVEENKKETPCDEVGCWEEISYFDACGEDVCCC